MIWIRLTLYTLISIYFLYTSGYLVKKILSKSINKKWINIFLNSNILFLGFLLHLFLSAIYYFILEISHIIVGLEYHSSWKLILYLQLTINISILMSSIFIIIKKWKKIKKINILYFFKNNIPLFIFVILYSIFSFSNPVYFFNNGATDNWLYIDSYSPAMMLNHFGIEHLKADRIENLTHFLSPKKHIFNFGIQSSIFFSSFTNILIIKKMYFLKTYLYFAFTIVIKIIFGQEIISLLKKLKMSPWIILLYPFIVPLVSVEMFKMLYLTFYPSVIIVTIFVIKLFDIYYEMFVTRDRYLWVYILVFIFSVTLFHGNSMIITGLLLLGYILSYIKIITNKWFTIIFILLLTMCSLFLNYYTKNIHPITYTDRLKRGEELFGGMLMIREYWYYLILFSLPVVFSKNLGTRIIITLILTSFIVINTEFYRSILVLHTPIITEKGTYVYGRVIIGISHFIPLITIGEATKLENKGIRKFYALIAWVPSLIYLQLYYIRHVINEENMINDTFSIQRLIKYSPTKWLKDGSVKYTENLDKWIESKKDTWGDSYTVIMGNDIDKDYKYYIQHTTNDRVRVDIKISDNLGPTLKQIKDPNLKVAPNYKYLIVKRYQAVVDFNWHYPFWKGPMKIASFNDVLIKETLDTIKTKYDLKEVKKITDNGYESEYWVFKMR